MHRASGAAGMLALLALAACAPDPDDLHLVLDLAAELPAAEVHRETVEIDFGTPEAAEHLLDGWSWNEREPSPDGGETTFSWGLGSASVLRFYLVSRRDVRLELRGRPYPRPGRLPQQVRVEVNGHPVAQLPLDPPAAGQGWPVLPVTVPRDRAVTGWNTVALAYRYAVQPHEAGLSGDRRALAVAWDRLRVDPERPPGPGPTPDDRPEASPDGLLRLPLGSSVSYFAPLPAGSVLALDGLRLSGTRGRLVVELQREGDAPVELLSLLPARWRRTFELPVAGGGLARLTLRAVVDELRAAPDGGRAGWIEVETPRVVAPPAEGAGAATAAGASGARAAAPSPPRPRPDVLVYLVDTLRADRVGTYGSTRGLTPAIDAFAAGAVVFEEAVTQAPWTRPAVASVLTGLPPSAHGVTTLETRLPDEALTLPELLRDLPGGAYRTAAWSTNWHVHQRTGMAQGFDDFHFFPRGPRAGVVHRSVLAWIDRHLARAPAGPGAERQPFFLYVHVLDPHAPYRPPEDLWRRFAPEVRNPEAGTTDYLRTVYGATGRERAELLAALPPLYDAETALADRAFGELLQALEKRGLRDEMLIVFLSDHGEELDEHGALGHGNDLYGETLDIPLIVRLPGREPGRAGRLALPMDVPATILAALGEEVPPGMAGIDLLAPARAPAEPPRAGFAHLDYEGRIGVSVILGEWKLIEPLTRALGRFPELYHLGRDPGERHDLAARLPVRAGYLRTLVRRHLLAAEAAGAEAERLEMDPELRRGLEALGYL